MECEIDLKPAEPQHVGLTLGLRATKECAQPCQQFIEIKRLDEVIIRTGIQTFHFLLRQIAGGEQQNRRHIFSCAHVLQHLDARIFGQVHIQHHRDEGRIHQHVHRRLAVLHPVDAISMLLQRLFKGLTEHRVIFY